MIFWKECCETLPAAILSVVIICVLSHIRWEGWRLEYFEFQFWAVTVVFLAFGQLFVGRRAFAGERENGTFENLLVRPVRPSHIFVTKYAVALGSLTLTILALFAIFVFIRPTHNLNLYDVARGLAILFAFATMALTVSFCISCFTDASAKAFIGSVILIFMLLFVITDTPFLRYAWWWSNSIEELWSGYVVLYGILSLVALAVAGVIFSKRLFVSYGWRHLSIAGMILFFFFVRSVSTTFWLIPQIAGSGDLGILQLCREPVEKILDYTSKSKPRANASFLLRQYLISSHDSRIDKELIQQLANPEPRIRNEALKTLTARKTEKARADVIRLLKDTNSEVRHSALSYVHGFKCEEAVPELRTMLNDPNSSIRERSVRALAVIDGKNAGPYLMSVLKDPNPRVCSAAAFELCQMDYGEARDEVVNMMLDNRVKYAREEAARALGYLKSAPACDALMQALSGDDSLLAESAMCSLGKLKCEDAAEPLIEELRKALLSDRKAVTQTPISERKQFGKQRQDKPTNEPPRYDARDSQSDPSKTALLINALKGIGSTQVKEAFKELFADHTLSPGIRTELAVSLVELGDKTTIPYLRKLMADGAMKADSAKALRGYAVRLAKAGEYSAIPILIAALDEGFPETRYSYGEVLRELTEKNYGWDSRRWRKWWSKNKEMLLQAVPEGNV